MGSALRPLRSGCSDASFRASSGISILPPVERGFPVWHQSGGRRVARSHSGAAVKREPFGVIEYLLLAGMAAAVGSIVYGVNGVMFGYGLLSYDDQNTVIKVAVALGLMVVVAGALAGAWQDRGADPVDAILPTILIEEGFRAAAVPRFPWRPHGRLRNEPR